jgi:HCOMODA/2-hydroxy-3-carboxy-muconic semialdehyde decarboxylase
MEFTLDSEPVDRQDRGIYLERFIHGAVYEARPEVQSVVHNHSSAVIPFTVTNVPLRPIIHTGALIGSEVPVWDIRDNFGDTNLLVTNQDQGRDLARTLGPGRVSLMRGHGCVVAGNSLRQAVMASVYLQLNAQLLLQSLSLGEVTYLSKGEVELMAESQLQPTGGADRVWEYWVRRAGCQGM